MVEFEGSEKVLDESRILLEKIYRDMIDALSIKENLEKDVIEIQAKIVEQIKRIADARVARRKVVEVIANAQRAITTGR